MHSIGILLSILLNTIRPRRQRQHHWDSRTPASLQVHRRIPQIGGHHIASGENTERRRVPTRAEPQGLQGDAQPSDSARGEAPQLHGVRPVCRHATRAHAGHAQDPCLNPLVARVHLPERGRQKWRQWIMDTQGDQGLAVRGESAEFGIVCKVHPDGMVVNQRFLHVPDVPVFQA